MLLRQACLASLVVLATTYTDVSSGDYCFDDSERHARLVSQEKITLDLLTWSSQKLATRVTEILIREKLGHDVEVRDYSTFGEGVSEAYTRVGTGEVDLNMELWPTFHSEARESAVRSEDKGARYLGIHGFSARSGWFVPLASLTEDMLAQTWQRTTTGSGEFTGAMRSLGWEQYASLSNLAYADVYSTLRRAEDLTAVNQCADLTDQAGGAVMANGKYSCELGNFVPNGAQCCSHGSPEGECDLALPKCPGVMQGLPSWDVAWNTQAAVQAQQDPNASVPLELVYGDRLAAVSQAEAEKTPLLVYGWEPDLFVSPDRFLRVRMTDYEYCSFQTNLRIEPPIVCDYPIVHVEKIGHYSVESLAADAWTLASRLTFSFEQMQRLLELENATGADDWSAACAWLKETEGKGVWEDWVNPIEEDWISAGIAGGFFVAAILWVWFAEPIVRIFARARERVGRCAQVAKCLVPCLPEAEMEEEKLKETMKEKHKEENMAAEEAKEEEMFNPDSSGATVTLGAMVVLAREDDTQVSIPVLRRNGEDSRLEVEVFTEDGSAKLGLNYLPIESSAGAKAEEDDKPSVTVLFEPGKKNNLQVVVVPLKRATGYEATVWFVVRLRLRATPDAKGPVQIGPVTGTRVRIVNVDAFPNGYLAPDSWGDLKPEERNLFNAKKRSIGASSGSIEEAGRTFFYCNSKQRDKIRLVINFFLEANRPHLYASAQHQLARLYLAAYSSIIYPYLYKILIDQVVSQLRYDIAVRTAFIAAGAYVVSYRMEHCFTKGWDVQKRLQLALARKFLSLSEDDREGSEGLTDRYRLAIMETSVNVTNDAFNGIHGVLGSIYSLIFGLSYLLFYSTAGVTRTYIGLTVLGILLVTTVMFSGRISGTWKIWHAGFESRQKLYNELGYLASNWRLIRRQRGEDSAASTLRDSVGAALVGRAQIAIYARATQYRAQLFMQAVIFAGWALAPLFTDPIDPLVTAGTFLSCLSVLSSFGNSIVALQRDLLKVYTAGSMVDEISGMLNEHTEQTRLLKRGSAGPQLAKGSPSQEEKTSTTRTNKQASTLVEDSRKAAINQAHATRDELTAALPSVCAGDNACKEHEKDVTNDVMLELQLISESSWMGRACFRIHQLSYQSAGPQDDYIFEKLVLRYGDDVLANDGNDWLTHADVLPGYAPAGRLIGLRANRGGGGISFRRAAELTLCKLLSKVATPHAGTAKCLPSMRVQLVEQISLITGESLMHNLLYGVVPRDAIVDGSVDKTKLSGLQLQKAPEDAYVWNLCKRVGVSSHLIGSLHREGWGELNLGATSALELIDLEKIALVRALLHTPEVLILYHFGNSCDLASQRHLLGVIRDYASATKFFKKDADAGHVKARTVLWAAADPMLANLLDEPTDLVLDLQGPSSALLSTAATWAKTCGTEPQDSLPPPAVSSGEGGADDGGVAVDVAPPASAPPPATAPLPATMPATTLPATSCDSSNRSSAVTATRV